MRVSMADADGQHVDVHLIETPTHGRVLVRRGDARHCLVGFHGYAQDAEEHMGELLQIPSVEEWTAVSVQALNRFYRGRTEAVVGNWMTSQDRELAIADNIEYVRKVVESLGDYDRLVFLGFSQGAAMAYRAAAAIRCDALVVLGGDMPPDVAPAALPPVVIGRGVRDDWYTAEKLAADRARLPAAEVLELDGGHEWTAAFRAKVGDVLRSTWSVAARPTP
jgi:predicted esterase